MIDIYILNIFFRDNPGIKVNTVAIFPVFNTQRSQGYIIIVNRVFKQTNAHAHRSQLRVIRNTK